MLEKKRYRHELLKEIVDWAVDFTKCSFQEGLLEEVPQLHSKEYEHEWIKKQIELLPEIRELRARSVYVCGISNEFKSHIKRSVIDLIDILREQIAWLYVFKRDATIYKNEPNWASVMIGTYKELLYDCATTLLENISSKLGEDI